MSLNHRPGVHVLIVDAVAARLAETRATVAAAASIVIETAMSPDEALAAVRTQDFDLAVLEARLGVVDGLALAGLLRQEPLARDLPLIVLADAAAEMPRLAHAVDPGIVDVLVRPIAAGLLARKIAFIAALGTQSRRLRDSAARMDRLRQSNEHMVSGLIHDLRTPLMAINLSAEVALMRSPEEAVQQAARRIRSSTARMSRVFDHLLNLARVDAEVPDVELKSADLYEVTSAVLEQVRAARVATKFEVIRDGELVGMFDAALIGRSIANIVGTLLEHVRSDAPITIRLDGTQHDRLRLEVATPAVIPAEARERMYMFRTNEAGSEVPGRGLGLHAVDPLVGAHGGSIVGRSRAPDGTVFELLLPRGAAGAQ